MKAVKKENYLNTVAQTDKSEYKILLVEDEEAIAKLFLYNLKKAGYTYEWAENGLEGYLLAKSFQPDVIVSDIMMPEVDGYQFRKMLLDDEKLKQVPFVFLSAKGDESDILNGYDLNIEDYIVKTSGSKIVLAKISSLLKSAQKEREKAVSEVHNAANTVGAKTVPDNAPTFDGFTIKHWHVPYQNIPGGDFIDYFKVDEDNMVVVLGDIMGKKWGAWYFAVAYAGYVRSAIRMILSNEQEELSPASILNKVNNAVFKDERISDVFITLSVICIDKKNNTLKYSGAGDLPLIHKTDTIDTIKSNGILIGFKDVGDYEDIEIDMEKDSEFYIITDGIPETRCTDGEFFGEPRLRDIIQNRKNDEDLLTPIISEFTEATNNKFEDDISIIAIKAA